MCPGLARCPTLCVQTSPALAPSAVISEASAKRVLMARTAVRGATVGRMDAGLGDFRRGLIVVGSPPFAHAQASPGVVPLGTRPRTSVESSNPVTICSCPGALTAKRSPPRARTSTGEPSIQRKGPAAPFSQGSGSRSGMARPAYPPAGDTSGRHVGEPRPRALDIHGVGTR